MRTKHRRLLLLSLLGLSCSSYADVQFNGFASVKGGLIFGSEKDLNGNGMIDANEQAFSGDFSEDLSFKPLSLFAIQARSDLGDGLSATVQLMAEGQNDFEVDARWAFLSYEFSDNWSVQAGRIILPAFYKSEFSNVGYAHNYNALPRSVYTTLSFSNVEGVRFVNTSSFGDWSLLATFGYSNWNGDITIGGIGQDFSGSLKNIVSGNFELNREWLTLFGGAFTTEAQFDSLDAAVIDPTIDANLGPAVTAGVITQADLDATKDALTFSGDGLYFYYGFDIDYNDWLATYEYAEYGIEDSGDSINEVWYLTVGKRIDDIVVTLTTGELQQPIDMGDVNQLNEVIQPLALNVKQSLAGQYYTMNQLSIRYNFHPAAAFKTDLFIWDPIDSGEELTGLSVGIDLVF